jgi:hypothetical protein
MGESNSVLDPENPPKHCPVCREKGVKSKVKIYKINLDNDGVIMCENVDCPWPLTTHGPDQVMLVVKNEEKKKKKKDKNIAHEKMPQQNVGLMQTP